MLRILGTAGVALLRGLLGTDEYSRCSVSLEPLINRDVTLGFHYGGSGLASDHLLGIRPALELIAGSRPGILLTQLA
jgi:hypothetical protein